jgi:hypothetical protein
METCCGFMVFSSFMRPRRQASSCPLVISVIIQASLSWTSWWAAIGRSFHCLRLFEYSSAQP